MVHVKGYKALQPMPVRRGTAPTSSLRYFVTPIIHNWIHDTPDELLDRCCRFQSLSNSITLDYVLSPARECLEFEALHQLLESHGFPDRIRIPFMV